MMIHLLVNDNPDSMEFLSAYRNFKAAKKKMEKLKEEDAYEYQYITIFSVHLREKKG